MCAVDALGIPFMLNQAVTITSRDPLTERPIQVVVQPGHEPRWTPEQTVVRVGSRGTQGSIALKCCQVINFFETHETAERYQRQHAIVQGAILAMPVAIQAGTLLFGSVLDV
jgi:hypothetical protein